MSHTKQHALMSTGVLIAVILGFYFILVYPALSKRAEMDEHISDLEFQYQKFASTLNRKDEIESEIQLLRNSDTDRGNFIQADSAALAAAELQAIIKVLIDDANARQVSTQVAPSKDDDTFPMITIKVHLRASISSTFDILYRLEASDTTLIIDNLYIQSRSQSARRAPNRQTAQTIMDDLDVRFDISGFIYQESSQ